MEKGNFKIELNVSDIQELLLGGQDAATSDRVRRWTERAIELVLESADARATYALYPVSGHHKNIRVGAEQIQSVKLSSVLSHCSQAIVFAVTLGHKLDKLIVNRKGEAFKMVLDDVAGRIADYATERAHLHLRSLVGPEEGLSERYSPGYCDWPLKGQTTLFRLLPEDTGIQLLDNHFMIPSKSVSGLIGIGSNSEMVRYGNACHFCGDKECPYRRE